MKKKIFILLIALIMPVMFLFAGCGENVQQVQDFKSQENKRFVFVEEYMVDDWSLEYLRVMVDKETKVMYLYYQDGNGYSSKGGLTVMLNEDGTPMLWNGELE